MNNPVHRRIVTGTETDPLLLVKQLVDSRYLKQPDNLEPFSEHMARQILKRTGANWTDSYDKNGAHLGVLATVKLGIGEPTHIHSSYPIHFGSASLVPGVWKIQPLYPDSLEWWKKPLDIIPVVGESWQYTPVLSYLIESKVPFECREGYYFDEGKRVMWKLYNYLKDWRERDKEACKQAYTRMLGILSHKPDTLYPGCIWRPDWTSTIIAESHVRVHRQAMEAYRQTGIYPVRWKVDCLYYSEPVSWFDSRLGNGIGEWKHGQRST